MARGSAWPGCASLTRRCRARLGQLQLGRLHVPGLRGHPQVTGHSHQVLWCISPHALSLGRAAQQSSERHAGPVGSCRRPDHAEHGQRQGQRHLRGQPAAAAQDPSRVLAEVRALFSPPCHRPAPAMSNAHFPVVQRANQLHPQEVRAARVHGARWRGRSTDRGITHGRCVSHRRGRPHRCCCHRAATAAATAGERSFPGGRACSLPGDQERNAPAACGRCCPRARDSRDSRQHAAVPTGRRFPCAARRLTRRST